MELVPWDDRGDAAKVGSCDNTAKVEPRGNQDNAVAVEPQDNGGGEAINGFCPWIDGGVDERAPVLVIDVVRWQRPFFSSSLPVAEAVTAVNIAACHHASITRPVLGR